MLALFSLENTASFIWDILYYFTMQLGKMTRMNPFLSLPLMHLITLGSFLSLSDVLPVNLISCKMFHQLSLVNHATFVIIFLHLLNTFKYVFWYYTQTFYQYINISHLQHHFSLIWICILHKDPTFLELWWSFLELKYDTYSIPFIPAP